MRWKHWVWVIFGFVQCAGIVLFLLDSGPCGGPGLLLLFPGFLVVLASPYQVHNLPEWAGYLVAGVVTVCANALVWYLMARLMRGAKTSG